MIFARWSVHTLACLRILNWNAMTRSCNGIIRMNKENPASAEGPSYATRTQNQTVLFVHKQPT